MRKTIIASDGFSPDLMKTRPAWLDLPRIARVEISSEDARYPVEQALVESAPHELQGLYTGTSGWRAEVLGPQTLSLRFDEPQKVKRVLLHFREAEQERSQEFTLHATMADGRTQEIVRQQWSFSPRGSTEEQENYSVNLEDVTTLTLWIDPDRGRDRYRATLEALRVEA
jgi:hypothetical protein